MKNDKKNKFMKLFKFLVAIELILPILIHMMIAHGYEELLIDFLPFLIWLYFLPIIPCLLIGMSLQYKSKIPFIISLFLTLCHIALIFYMLEESVPRF